MACALVLLYSVFMFILNHHESCDYIWIDSNYENSLNEYNRLYNCEYFESGNNSKLLWFTKKGGND